MKELLPVIQQWKNASSRFALATVIQTWGSSPRPVGSVLVVNQDMEMAGSVSGGCVEGAVIKAAMPLLEKNEGQRLAFGVADEEAWSVGLSCGGKVQVFVEACPAFAADEKEQQAWASLQAALNENAACIWVTKLVDGQGWHSCIFPDGSANGQTPSDALQEAALTAYNERKSQSVEVEGASYFLRVYPRRSQLLIIGAAHITADLVELGRSFDFETVVIDPRGVFAQKTHFASPPDQIIEEYPAEVLPDFTLDAYTYAVILSHDPKIDDNALHLLLPSEVAYIGALGSRKTHAKRVARLTEAGFSAEQIERIAAPVGLSIKAKSPREIALSIMGQIIEVKNQYL